MLSTKLYCIVSPLFMFSSWKNNPWFLILLLKLEDFIFYLPHVDIRNDSWNFVFCPPLCPLHPF